MMAELFKNVWNRTPWPEDGCDVCRRTVDVNREARSIKAAVADGCISTSTQNARSTNARKTRKALADRGEKRQKSVVCGLNVNAGITGVE